MQCFVIAVKGPNTIAQGEALGSEINENFAALKGRHTNRDLYCALSELTDR
jgi:hypothetical protein